MSGSQSRCFFSSSRNTSSARCSRSAFSMTAAARVKHCSSISKAGEKGGRSRRRLQVAHQYAHERITLVRIAFQALHDDLFHGGGQIGIMFAQGDKIVAPIQLPLDQLLGSFAD